MFIAFYQSPIGIIQIEHSGVGISLLIFTGNNSNTEDVPELIRPIFLQLDEYFAGERKEFNIPLDLTGTDFQKQVWSSLLEIPFGHTISYMDIAKKLGDPKTIRAVGNANGKNPVSIIIPCHRVIGSDGSLIGYAGGLWRKEWLLNHENKYKQLSLF